MLRRISSSVHRPSFPCRHNDESQILGSLADRFARGIGVALVTGVALSPRQQVMDNIRLSTRSGAVMRLGPPPPPIMANYVALRH